MSQSKRDDYENVFEIVRYWTPSQRFNLMQDILKTLAPQEETAGRKRQAVKEVFGILATGQTPPSDEEIKQWLDEHRWEKYGK
jgi:hypothetical protein